MTNIPDFIDQRFHHLIVRARAPNDSAGNTQWSCVCDCGSNAIVRSMNLKSGKTKSCGCLKRASRNATHGQSETQEYRAWSAMKDRCTNPHNKSFKDYGGRGIRVCSRWESSFETFFADVGRRPHAHAQLNRIDNGGDYEPGNVEWTTPVANMNNRRTTTYLEHAGQTLPLADWARKTGIDRYRVKARLRIGWSVAEALEFESRVQP